MRELKSNHRRNRIAKRLILAIILCSSFIALVTTGVQLYVEYRQDLGLIQSEIESIRDRQLAALSHSVRVMDSKLIQMQLAGLLNQRDLEYAVVETAAGQNWSAGQPLANKRISAELPLGYESAGAKKRIGVLTIVASLDDVQARLIDKALFLLFGNFLGIFLLALFTFAVFKYLVTRHLVKLAHHVTEINFSGTPSPPLQLERHSKRNAQADELDLVVSAINSMQTNMAEFIEEQQRTEDQLRRSEEHLQAILNNAMAVIAVRDLQGRYQYVNPRYEEVFGVSKDAVRGRTVEDLFPSAAAEILRANDLEAITRNEAVVVENMLPQQDGQHTYLTVRFPLRDEVGQPYAVCGMGTDITEVKRSEEQHQAHIHFLECMDQVNRVIQQADDVEQMLRKVLQTTFAIFGCDRIWLMNPCDPDAPSYCIPVEVTRPEYPGANVQNQEIPMKPGGDMLCAAALAAPGAVQCHSRSEPPIFRELTEQFSVLSQLSVAIYPRIGKPWMLGMHQCSYERIWTEAEQRLFEDIGRRIGDGLSTLLLLRDLRASERRYHDLADLLPQAVFELDTKGDITFGNRQGFALFGYSPADLAEKTNIMQFFPPQDRERLAEGLRDRLHGSEGKGNEYQVLRRDGSSFPALVYSAPIERNAEVVGIRGLLIDITDRKRDEDELKRHRDRLEELVTERSAALRQSEQRLALAMDAANDGLWDFNPQTGATYHSPRWYTMLGYQPDEMPPSYATFTDLIHPEDRAEAQALIERHNASGEPFSCEFRMRQKDGGYLWILDRGRAVEWDEQGRPLRLIGMHTDISARKQAEEAMAKAKAMAEAASHAKSEFLANMSHEIRTPLNVVTGYSELLSSMVSDPAQQSYLEAIKTAGKSLLTLVSDVLDLSKIEAGMLEIVHTPVSLQLLFGEMSQIFKVKLGSRNLQLKVAIDPELPALLQLDETRIRQILLNLVGNAVKFTQEGEISLTAKRLEAVADQYRVDLLIAVEDTGIGIPEDEQGQIFESFKQLTGHDSKKYGGTGLGLAICKRLVEMMNGRISVSSRPGGGSIFEVTLRGVEFATTEESAISDGALPAVNYIFEKARILVVDDVESNRDLLSELLARVNLDVLTAENGQEALNLVEEYRPELIIMDIRMPVLDGIAATRQLKANPKTSQIPVIALTASTTEDQSSLTEQGFDGYLVKPAGSNRLFMELARYLAHRIEAEPEAEKIPGESLEIEKIAELEELIAVFNEEVLPAYEGVKGAMEMSMVQHFGEKVVELGRKHNALGLVNYGAEIISYVEQVDIINTRRKIQEFPELAKQLSNAVGRNHD